jgi:hypothetical protein
LITEYTGIIPSFLQNEYDDMASASIDFPVAVTPSIQMSCMRAYQRAISDASRRLPCGICGGLFQEEEVLNISLRDERLLYYLQRTQTSPDCCAITDDVVTLCGVCNSAIIRRTMPPLSAGNFVNCLFCQDYPAILKGLNVVEERFIARAHVIGAFLKLTSGAQKGISYRGGRGHYVAVKQDPSNLLSILPTRRLRDHTMITVSWEQSMPPSEENLSRFCSVDKNKVLHALLWLCATNPVYKSVTIDYELLDSWPDNHIPQEIRDAFLVLDSKATATDNPITDEREGYATSLQGGQFENELDAEVDDAEPGSIISRSFFSDFHGQDLQSTPALIASLQDVLAKDSNITIEESDVISSEGNPGLSLDPGLDCIAPHISYKRAEGVPLLNSFTDPEYFTASFPTLFPFGIGGHLGDILGNRPGKVPLQDFAKYTMMHHSLLYVPFIAYRKLLIT